jgi:hypothetical protein
MGAILKKTAILLGAPLALGGVGLVVPMLFDRDVGGVLAAELLGIVGLVAGGVLGWIIVRRNFE